MSETTSTVARTVIEQQAIRLLETTDDVTSLVAALEFESLASYEDARIDWHSKYNLASLVRAMYLRELTGYSNTELADHLNEVDNAARLGFDTDQFCGEQAAPVHSTFSRAWNHYFGDDLKHYIQQTSDRILDYAHEQGNPLGMRALEPEDKGEVSTAVETRYTRKKISEVIQEMKRLVYPEIDLGRPEEGVQYHDNAFLDMSVLMSLHDTAAETGSTIYDDHTTRSTGAPDGDTHLYWLKQLHRAEILSFVDDAIERMITPAKRHLEFSRPADLAIDITYLAYYPDEDRVELRTTPLDEGEPDDVEMVQGAPTSKEYVICYKVATCCIVGENVQFTLGVEPVPKGRSRGELVRELVWKAKEHVSINTVYADREFDAADVVHSLNEAGVEFVIPRRKTSRIKNFIQGMSKDIEVERDHAIYGDIDGVPGHGRAEAHLIGVPKKNANDEDRVIDSTIVFLTNKDINNEIRRDRMKARGAVNRYRRRWGIENSYKSIKDFLAWTTSKEYSVRLFYVAFAVLLYNMWLLVDFLVQVSIKDVEHRYKPCVTAKRFLALAKEELGDVG
ncbi:MULTISPECIES: transposase [Halorussus]|uniref:transposase n=1 Tax=Halorussus TaxID=1070314 RepID=UPI0020A1B6DE|nr:transposase [Halorussus vallis]USZ78463.1 transposase [Halorussus vallis]USZ78495.1 transposase [Halorussus vallis]